MKDVAFELYKKKKNAAIKKAWQKYPNPNDKEKRQVYILDLMFG